MIILFTLFLQFLSPALGSDGRLIISEILPDPSPSVGLPETEYIELWNTGRDSVDLHGWSIRVGKKTRSITMDNNILPPDTYVLLCSTSGVDKIQGYLSQVNPSTPVISIDSWPTLPNGGTRITLITPEGGIMHSLTYSDENWPDALKEDGGWSLELIDPDQYCRPDNWAPSTNPKGGSPGMPNSVSGDLPPGESPRLLRAMLLPNNCFGLLYSSSIDPLMSNSPLVGTLYPGALMAPLKVDPNLGSSILSFSLPDDFDPSLRYKIHVDEEVYNCIGQLAYTEPIVIAFPSQPDSGDVVINEIMYDPLLGEPEWVELYNQSQKVIEVSTLILAKGYVDSSEKMIVSDYSDDQTLPFLLFPNTYCILTKSQLQRHPIESGDPIEAVTAVRNDLPTLPNAPAALAIMDDYQRILDQVFYSPDFQYPLIPDTKGVSLERISPEVGGMDPQNWFSSATGHSCGLQNSCYASQHLESESFVWERQPALPIIVRYSFPQSGWFAKIWIYDGFGHPVREISSGSVMAREGVIQWDGLSDRQTPQPAGIYVMVVNYMHANGKKGKWRSAVSLHR